jgi:hypothetical protein
MALHDYDKAMDVVTLAVKTLPVSATERQSLDDLQSQVQRAKKKNTPLTTNVVEMTIKDFDQLLSFCEFTNRSGQFFGNLHFPTHSDRRTVRDEEIR